MGFRTLFGLKKPKQKAVEKTAPFFAAGLRHLDSHSQLQQDLWIVSEVGETHRGFFVEVGAFDGVNLSNTYLLEKLGWSGILAEPNPKYTSLIRESRLAQLCTQPVAGQSGETLTMLFCPDTPELSSMSKYADNDMHAEARKNSIREALVSISLNDLLKTRHAPRKIDFISLDTEGSELEILSSFDFSNWDVERWASNITGRQPRMRSTD